MDHIILAPKYRKGKKPVKVRKPSRPLDGINHRLLQEKAAAAPASMPEPVPTLKLEPVPEDNDPVTREELEAKATELGIPFNGRTSNKKLTSLIETALVQETGG